MVYTNTRNIKNKWMELTALSEESKVEIVGMVQPWMATSHKEWGYSIMSIEIDVSGVALPTRERLVLSEFSGKLNAIKVQICAAIMTAKRCRTAIVCVHRIPPSEESDDFHLTKATGNAAISANSIAAM